MAFMFENLQVYQKAVDFADRTATHTETFPRGYYFLVDQLNRAALSISTNLAEGNGRFTKPDRKNFFTIARRGNSVDVTFSVPVDVTFSVLSPFPFVTLAHVLLSFTTASGLPSVAKLRDRWPLRYFTSSFVPSSPPEMYRATVFGGQSNRLLRPDVIGFGNLPCRFSRRMLSA
jgi:hypothetical protein